MKHIKFRYRDELSNFEWREQECYVSSLEQCMKIYGLWNCEHEILLVEEKA